MSPAAERNLRPPGLAGYVVEPGRHDELRDGEGRLRPHWQPLLGRCLAGTDDTLQRGIDLARRLVLENGVTYNVYADPQGRDRPWGLDPLPFVIDAAEWAHIERGVAQRATLLDAMLADLYGPQALLQAGALPPELVYGHPNFLWPCRHLKPPGGTWLHLYAVDLARAPDGRWWVLGDRTQTPSGPGYALENRQIISRVFPEAGKALGLRPISGFFAGLRDGLLDSPVAGRDPGLAVVLTPGPFNETYFEHAYLARQLGLPLVEGNDLTVRGDTVFLKTVAGLKRVQAILRRLDDDFCDPVELRADSALGVPGLLAAVRAGRVVLANAMGTGVAESAALQGFLPGIAARLTGQTLVLPTVATWWCGERPALDFVIEHLDRLVIKATYPNQRFEPVFGQDLDKAARRALIARLQARPGAYVAQERIRLSQAPAWREPVKAGLQARSVGLRVYAIATPSGYRVMPGGMARVAAGSAADVLSTQRGAGSKDVWVPGLDAALPEESAGVTCPVVGNYRDELPSSLVENLFWLGRYSERCEDKTRLLRATFAVRPDARLWRLAVAACQGQGLLGAERDPEDSMFDAALPLGLAADLGRLAWSASRSRPRLSLEHWRSLTELQQQVQRPEELAADPLEALDRLLLGLASFAGFTLDDMTQDVGWRLLMLGRQLERLQFLAGLFANRLEGGRVPLRGELDWLLDVGGSTITHRTRYVAAPRLSSVVQLLALEATNPRSLACQWHAVEDSLRRLPTLPGAAPETAWSELIARLLRTDLVALEAAQAEGRAARSALCTVLLQLQAAAQQLCDRLGERHFTHVDVDAQLVLA